MHTIAALEEGSERRIWEVVLHLEQVDEFGHSTALLDDLIKVEVRVGDELVNCFLVSKDTILVRLTVFEHTKVGLSGHQEPLLNDIHQTEAKEVQRDVHEVGR